MNSTSTSPRPATGCKSYYFSSNLADQHFPADFYGLLITAAVLNSVTCPFVIFLNGLVIMAVKTKRRLQTNPNILLACLSITDMLVGLIVQPLHVTTAILLFLGKRFDEFCEVTLAFSVTFLILGGASFFHLPLISWERYFAIKHAFTHGNFVTKCRLMAASALAWFVAVVTFTIPKLMFFFVIRQAATISSIIVFQILVYRDARRHEKQILAQHASLEARAKFEKEKKALKLTTIIISAVIVSYASPVIIFAVTPRFADEERYDDVKMAARELAFLPVILNSLINPIIYTVRSRQFRIAFIELLLRKGFQEANAFERRLFGSNGNAVRPEARHNGGGRERLARPHGSLFRRTRCAWISGIVANNEGG